MRIIEVNLDKDPYKVLYTDIQQGIQKQTGEVKDKAHPISLLRKAYGI